MPEFKKPKNVKTPEDFLKLWDLYKINVDENPHVDEVATGKGDIVSISKKRPYLRQGFESYVYRTKGFHIHQYIDNYNNSYPEYLGVVTCARKEWEDDQISGSLTGRYKSPNLVARINGLTDKKETTHKGLDLGMAFQSKYEK